MVWHMMVQAMGFFFENWAGIVIFNWKSFPQHPDQHSWLLLLIHDEPYLYWLPSVLFLWEPCSINHLHNSSHYPPHLLTNYGNYDPPGLCWLNHPACLLLFQSSIILIALKEYNGVYHHQPWPGRKRELTELLIILGPPIITSFLNIVMKNQLIKWFWATYSVEIFYILRCKITLTYHFYFFAEF